MELSWRSACKKPWFDSQHQRNRVIAAGGEEGGGEFGDLFGCEAGDATGGGEELTLENPEMQLDWTQSAGKAQEAGST